MSREHARRPSHSHGSDGNDSGGRDLRQLGMMKRAQDRKRGAGHAAEQSNTQTSPAIAEARHKLRDKVTHELRETMYAALDVFQAMVRADERHETEVSIGFGKAVGAKVSSWLEDKALDVSREAFEMGESVLGGAISTVFGAAKGRLENVADAGGKIKASEAVDKVVGEARALTDRAAKAGGEAVDRLSDAKMAEIAGVLDQFESVRSDADSEAEGSLRHGLEEWAMERMGAPKTGGAAIHEHAVELYEVYRSEVAKGLPAREGVDEAGAAMRGETHRHAEDAAGAAEKKLGVEDEVQKDTVERQRVETEAG